MNNIKPIFWRHCEARSNLRVKLSSEIASGKNPRNDGSNMLLDYKSLMYNLPNYLFTHLPIYLLFLCSCENDIAVVNSITSVNQLTQPTESSKNVEFLYSDSARVKSKLSAPLIDHYVGKKPYYEMPKGMNIVFFDRYRKEQSKLTANYGIGYETDNRMNTMEAKGNVIVINVKGDKLNTEHLTWNSLTKKVYTDEFVKITTKDEVIWGNGLEANEDFSEYVIKHVKGEIAVKDEGHK